MSHRYRSPAFAKSTAKPPCTGPKAPAARVVYIHACVIVWLIGITGLLYLRAADYPMVFDDLAYLQNNPLFTDSSSFGFFFHYREFLLKPASLGLDPELAMNFVLRPVAYATLHLNYLFDGFNPRWYRLTNVLIHTANACLIYALLRRIMQLAGDRLSGTSRLGIALATATLFAVHPLAVESVTYIVQRFTSLAAFFFMLALLLQMKTWTMANTIRRFWIKAAAVGVLLLGMLTKECVITAPVMVVLLDVMVLGTTWDAALRRNLALLACLPLIPLQVLLISWTQNAGVLDLQHAVNMTNLQSAPFAHLDFLITQSTVLLHYLRLIVWPQGLRLDPEWPVYSSLLQAPVLLSMVALAAMLLAAFWLRYRDRTDPRTALIAFFTTWFFITIAPSSGVVPLPDLVAEHRSYLPSIGILVALACLLDIACGWLENMTWQRRSLIPALIPALTAACALALASVTWQRHDVWSNRISLWEDVTSKSPGRARAWNNLGSAYCAQGRFDEAIPAYMRAIEVLPMYEVPYLNLMMLHNLRQEYHQALSIHERLGQVSKPALKSLHVIFQEAQARIGLGAVDTGVQLLEHIIEVDPHYRPSLVLLGAIYQDNRLHDKALSHLQRAIALAPDDGLAQMIDRSRRAINGD